METKDGGLSKVPHAPSHSEYFPSPFHMDPGFSEFSPTLSNHMTLSVLRDHLIQSHLTDEETEAQRRVEVKFLWPY